MLWKRRTERRSGAALALRDRCACYAELLREGGRARLVNADKIPLPDGLVSHGRLANGAALGAFLRKKLAFRWGKLPFAVGIPSADCLFRLFSLPAADLEEARASMTWCFSDYFPFDFGEALFDLCEVAAPPRGGRLNLVGTACAKAQILPFLESLRAPRARVFAAEPQIVASTRVRFRRCRRALPAGRETRRFVALRVRVRRKRSGLSQRRPPGRRICLEFADLCGNKQNLGIRR